MPTKRGKPTVAERIAAGEIDEDPRKKTLEKARESNLHLPNSGWLTETEEEKRAYVSKTMTELLEYWNVERVQSDEEAQERIGNYFLRCAQKGIKPTVEEMCMALGVPRTTLWDWETGRRAGPVSADTLKRAKSALAAFDARAVVENKLNPVTYIFRSKNFYGMVDKQEHVLTPNTNQVSREELEEAAKLLPGE